jgi:hypothetical protein
MSSIKNSVGGVGGSRTLEIEIESLLSSVYFKHNCFNNLIIDYKAHENSRKYGEHFGTTVSIFPSWHYEPINDACFAETQGSTV